MDQEMGRAFLSSRKLYIEKDAYQCRFRYSLEKEQWEIVTASFFFMDETGDLFSELPSVPGRLIFLVQAWWKGFELIRCFCPKGKDTHFITIPADIKKLRRGCFSREEKFPGTSCSTSVKSIRFLSVPEEIEEGAFIDCVDLQWVEGLPIIKGPADLEILRRETARYVMLDKSNQGDYFLYDTETFSILRYFPDEMRRKDTFSYVSVPWQTKRIGAGAFQGRKNIYKITGFDTKTLMWIGTKAFQNCGTYYLERDLADSCLIEKADGRVKTFGELKYEGRTNY